MNKNERQNVINDAVKALNMGEIILYPTDTIWGIGCDATNKAAIDKIYEIKERPQDKKLIVLFSSISMIHAYFEPSYDFSFVNQSNIPSTYIVDNPSTLPKNLYSSDGIAIRIPRSAWLLELINEFGAPLISTSANLSGDVSPKEYFEVSSAIKNRVNFIVPEYFDDGTHRPSQIFKKIQGELKKVR